MANDHESELLKEVRSVRILLILQAMAMGCQQKHIAAALGVSDATLSRMFPKGLGKEMTKIADRRRVGAKEE